MLQGFEINELSKDLAGWQQCGTFQQNRSRCASLSCFKVIDMVLVYRGAVAV